MPYYYDGKRGNKPYEPGLMIRLYLLQNLYNLSDMGTRNEVIDSRAFSSFCRVSSRNQIPDGDTLGRFRHILEKNHLQEQIFDTVLNKLRTEGKILKKGTIVDSTIIDAPSSTKNKENTRDPEAHSTKKGQNYRFGYKAHIGVDSESGIVHDLEVTAANAHDVTVAKDLLTGEEEEVYGDSGYLGIEKRDGAVRKNTKGQKIRYKINKRPSQCRQGTNRSKGQVKWREREKSKVRAKVEHVFGIIKGQFRTRKTRYRGLMKGKAKMNILFALANRIIADRNYLAA